MNARIYQPWLAGRSLCLEGEKRRPQPASGR
jgi:hypothetical protein